MTDSQFYTLRSLGRVWHATHSTSSKFRLGEAICLARGAGSTWAEIAFAAQVSPSTAKRYSQTL